MLIYVVLQNINKIEVTPDMRYLAVAGNPHIRLFDIASSSTQPVCLHSVFFKNPFIHAFIVMMDELSKPF